MPSIQIGGVTVEEIAADVLQVEPGVFSVLHQGRSYQVRLSQNEATVNGHRFLFDIADPRQWKRAQTAASTTGPAAIIAPMPGKVVRILVSEGDHVSAGQGIIVVEAMKMQNELKSPRDGQVKQIKAEPNQSVNAGTILALIESIY